MAARTFMKILGLAVVVFTVIFLTFLFIYTEEFYPHVCPPCQKKIQATSMKENDTLSTKENQTLSTTENKTLDFFNREKMQDLRMDPGLKYDQPSAIKTRTDVNSVTPWGAPIIWDGTFDPVLLNHIYQRIDPRVAVLVLAVHKYTRYLKGFLESGEKYFLLGFKVTWYIFTDHVDEVPNVELGPGRNITVFEVPHATRWQDVVFSKMQRATDIIEKSLHKDADYLFMMDIDLVFHNPIGPEILSRLTATLHRTFKDSPRAWYTYDRNPPCNAYIPLEEGDYYFTAAVFGGYMEDMYKLVKHCWEKSQEDKEKGIEAAWQEESHINKYFLLNKPTKILSAEYLWVDYDPVPGEYRVIRLSQLDKNYAEVRPN